MKSTASVCMFFLNIGRIEGCEIEGAKEIQIVLLTVPRLKWNFLWACSGLYTQACVLVNMPFDLDSLFRAQVIMLF